jgi:hypothetical protein
MDASPQSQTTTRMFSRVLGPFLVIVDITAIARASTMQTLLSQFEANSLWTWVAGAFILVFGLVVVAAHEYWRGVAPTIVSALGWLITLRGLLLLAFPQTFVSIANSMIGAQGTWISLCVVFTAIGLYLTYIGWAPQAKRSTPHATGASPHLPRAA